MHVGVIDNDCFAANMMVGLIQSLPGSGVMVDWATDNPALALQRCLYDVRKIDALIMDMSMGQLSGPSLCRRIRTADSQITVIGVTSFPLDEYKQEAIDAGFQALISKKDFRRMICPALEGISHGGVFPADGGFKTVQEANAAFAAVDRSPTNEVTLSRRESEIMARYRAHWTTTQIAEDMGVGEETIYTHVRRVMRKLGVHSRNEALALCARFEML